LDFSLFSSGFIGVDIFFVISGYLISSIIFEKLLQNQFSFIDFYQRRIRRIFPALITILTFCLIFGWFFLISEEYKNLSKHVAGGASFISNYVLWSESGYFDKASHSKPLLHLWSLGIEEQFYIFFPLFLWIVWKLKLNLLFLISILITLSFILNLLNVIDDPVGTFYSPFTRIWELLAGSILAYFKIFHHSFTKKLNFFISFFKKKKNYKYPNAEIITQNILTSFGFLLILSSYYFIDLESSFPGLIATMPVMGVFLCISAGPLAWFNKYILSNKILVFFWIN
jgi:peptidoglycan/LPS O-acetylase OafA/YrhL